MSTPNLMLEYEPIPLALAYLCESCQRIGASPARCTCGSTALLALASILDRPRPAALDYSADLSSTNGAEKSPRQLAREKLSEYRAGYFGQLAEVIS